MKYGHFSDDGTEYVITTPSTPRPWINYLTNGRYCGLISQSAGGYGFLESSGYNRLTRGNSQDAIIADEPGRYLYFYDHDTKQSWRQNGHPGGTPPDFWETRHGMGYTVLHITIHGIESEITYFCPLDDDLEVWLIKLTNRGSEARDLSAFGTVEWSVGNYIADQLEAEFSKLFNVATYENQMVFATKRLWDIQLPGGIRPNATWGRYAFLGSSLPVEGYDCFREDFLGMYRVGEFPIAVEQGRCRNTSGMGRDAIAALQHRIKLEPGKSIEFVMMVGATRTKEEARALRDKYADIPTTHMELGRLHDYWEEYLAQITVDTPDPDFNLSVNIWNKYQAWVLSFWARMDSYYIGGGSIIGFRDSCQDVLGVLPQRQEWARKRILYIATHQFSDGSTLHNWDPITDYGPKTGHSDDPLWLVMVTVEYLKETGDWSILDEAVEYMEKGEGTLYEHLRQGMQYTRNRRSQRGLPLLGAADWNDGLDHAGDEGRGESVMVAEHLAWMLQEMAHVARHYGDTRLEREHLHRFDEMKEAINDLAWDGKWYIRGTLDDGTAFGSKDNAEGKIYLNAQSWAVMSGVADGRASECMDAVAANLNTAYGPALFLPAYNEPNPKIGIITRFCPGTKENGTIFNHPVCWAVIAECILGRGDAAFNYWRETSFLVRGKDPDHYKAEPYVYAEYIYGPDHPAFGQGEFTWTTGTAPWMMRASLDWICGVRPEHEGLRIDPCIPTAWGGFKVRRPFRGAVYEIEVENPDHISKGVQQVIVDGQPAQGNLLPIFGDGETHQVRVRMGE